MSDLGADESVAIVHDYLNQRGGAERVVLELARMWPHAPIYTSFYRRESTFPQFAGREIRSSYLDRIPSDKRFRALLPLFPSAFRSFGTLGQGLVISSSSGWAHGVRTSPDSTHVVYCHNPARWLYAPGTYLQSAPRLARRLAKPMLRTMRHWDVRAARRADLYIANSETVRSRIRATYGIDSEVVFPPVDVDRFRPRPRGNRLLVVSRLLPYKRVDIAVEAANRLDLPLDVIGVGPSLPELRALAGPRVVFHGRLEDAEVTELMEACRALVLTGEEDFGITPVEAMAAGKPVIAFAAGGALETLEEGTSASFFHEQSPEALIQATHRLEDLDTPPEDLAHRASRFSPAAFREHIAVALTGALERNRTSYEDRSPSRASRRSQKAPAR